MNKRLHTYEIIMYVPTTSTYSCTRICRYRRRRSYNTHSPRTMQCDTYRLREVYCIQCVQCTINDRTLYILRTRSAFQTPTYREKKKYVSIVLALFDTSYQYRVSIISPIFTNISHLTTVFQAKISAYNMLSFHQNTSTPHNTQNDNKY